jgi:hypothetical protein
MEKTLKKEAGFAVSAAEKKDDKKMQLHSAEGAKVLKKLQDIVKRHLDIKKDFKKEIAKSKDKKMIENSIKEIEKIGTDAQKGWESASSEAAKHRG